MDEGASGKRSLAGPINTRRIEKVKPFIRMCKEGNTIYCRAKTRNVQDVYELHVGDQSLKFSQEKRESTITIDFDPPLFARESVVVEVEGDEVPANTIESYNLLYGQWLSPKQQRPSVR